MSYYFASLSPNILYVAMKGNIDSKLERLFFFGRPFSPIYGFLMTTRSSLYQQGFFKQHNLGVPVISVGNIVLGGTGKTPLVHYIANLLKENKKKPAILSRGYKGSANAALNIVSNPSTILLSAKEAGDEPRLLAEKLPGIPVITGKKRFATGRFAIQTFGADAIILDDGFQHMALKRDIDLVLFSAQKGLGNARVMPGGDLREPLSALQRADAFIISGVEDAPDRAVEDFHHFLAEMYPEKPVFKGSYQTEDVLPGILNGINEEFAFNAERQKKVYGFCGIARPESFRNSLLKNNFSLTGFHPFDDHHVYTADTIDSLIIAARDSGAQSLITTEKDLVKLQSFYSKDFPILALPVVLQMNGDFDQYLINHLATAKKTLNNNGQT